MKRIKNIPAIVLKGALITLDAMLGHAGRAAPRMTQARWRRYYLAIAPL